MCIPGNLSSPWDKAQKVTLIHAPELGVVQHIWNPTIQGVETEELLQFQSQGGLHINSQVRQG